VLTGQECERSRRQQALHCGHSGKSGQRGRRVATGLRGYGACEAAEGVVQKSGAKDESSRSGTLTFNGTHASERGAAARKVEWGPALREFENFVGSRFTPVRVVMVIFVFDTQHANNIPTDSPEHGDHHGTLGMHRACIKHELPTSEGMTFFHTLRAQAQRVHHKADSRRGEAARGRSRARSNGNQSHLTARHIFS
jgi:hypothetical protein